MHVFNHGVKSVGITDWNLGNDGQRQHVGIESAELFFYFNEKWSNASNDKFAQLVPQQGCVVSCSEHVNLFIDLFIGHTYVNVRKK